MITRSQLEVVARREGIALPAVERDYIQHVLLRHAAGPPLVFKGGTCLRIAYGSPRYSEDLDFNADTDARGAFDHLVTSSARLPNYGMPATVVRRPSREGLAAVLHCEGPLFSGNPRSRASVRIEVSLRHEPVATAEVFVPRTPYADVPQLVLRTLRRSTCSRRKSAPSSCAGSRGTCTTCTSS